MKQTCILLLILTIVIGFSLQVQAELFNRGTDINGNRLIYDSDLNITWYDYTKTADTWSNQSNWAASLSVSGGNLAGIYNDWRLPFTVDGEGLNKYLYESGYNITSSEMGHLYYTELGNKANNEPGGGLAYKGDFKNLQPNQYWTGTHCCSHSHGANYFSFNSGWADAIWDAQYTAGYEQMYAIAVRPGDVTVVPEPISSILFLTGGVALIGRKYIRRKKEV